MTQAAAIKHFERELVELAGQSLLKAEHPITGPQGAHVRQGGTTVPLVNMCANNYLGLAGDPRLSTMAKNALDRHGFGMASVRFICGTQDVHKALENRLSHYLGTDDAILYSSCFDANGGLFETFLDERDAIISADLNHASIIDGIRLTRAKRFTFHTNNLTELEEKLKESADFRFRMIATDGVFSMDGILADLPGICDLADRYDALVMVDDSHGVGVFGPKGAGTPAHFGVTDRIDLLTGTLGKALGGAAGGYTAGRAPLIAWLRQRSRPYLFSNALPPAIAATSIGVIDLLESDDSLRQCLWKNTIYFRNAMISAGFVLGGSGTPIVPVMLGEAETAVRMSELLFTKGIFAVAFSYPVVPAGKARIRTQMSAAHGTADLDRAVAAFTDAGRALGLLG